MPPSRTWPNASTSPLSRASPPSAGDGALGDDDDRRVVRCEAAARPRRTTSSMSNGCSGIRIDVGAAGQAGVQRDPAGVAAHHLDDQRAVVRLGRRVQPVDRLDRDRRPRCRSRTCSRWRSGRCRSSSARRRRRCRRRSSRFATPRVSSPPIAISASMPWAAKVSRIRSTPPSTLKGLVRDEPRIVPPRGRMPRRRPAPAGGSAPRAGPSSRPGSPTNSWP